jgi:NAD(P)-dependent dehydrogenase (short-subunit alcohol dehydrogenase family)
LSVQTVLVTGAASGIGAAVALAAARDGARVGVLDLDGQRADEIAREAESQGAQRALALQADVSDERAVERAVARCRAELGVPTAVLANAGIEVNGSAHELPLAQWKQLLEVNLTGAFLTARHAIRAMLDAGVGGSVVCTSSPSAFVGFAGGGNAAYAASKGGISAMVRSLALDYASAGIRVNAVVPGATDTPLLTATVAEGEHAAARERLIAEAAEQIPLGRLGTPDEVAEAVIWLWSERASYVTGSHLFVDGGLTAKGANTF